MPLHFAAVNDQNPKQGPPPFQKHGDSGKNAGMEFAGVGIQFAASIVLFLYLGQWLDRKLGTAPWLLIIGVFAGGGLGFWSMYRKLMAAQERDERARREGKTAP